MTGRSGKEIPRSSLEAARAEVYSLLAGLLAEAPSRSQLSLLTEAGIVEDLHRRAVESGLDDLPELSELSAAIGGTDAAWDAVRREFNILFLGPGKLPAPPWESVYLGPERLVMQAPAQEVLRDYVEAGLGYDGMMACPPDHVAKELAFMAALIEAARESNSAGEAARQRQRQFLGRHILRWVPQFCADLECAEEARCYRVVARLLRRFLEGEQRILLG